MGVSEDFKTASCAALDKFTSVHTLPYREGVQIFPFITLPQEIASILPVGKQQCFCCMSGKIIMIPPGKTQGVKASFMQLLTDTCCIMEPSYRKRKAANTATILSYHPCHRHAQVTQNCAPFSSLPSTCSENYFLLTTKLCTNS